MRRLLAAAAALGLLAACEPEYADAVGHAGREELAPAEGREAEHRLEVTGAADPEAISGNRTDTTETIHHPAADGNSGRPSDDSGAPSAAGHSGMGH
jgi:hypothetical protein